MRKGQKKILQYVRKWGYSNGCIKALSREDLTLKQLNSLLSLLHDCKDKDEKWINVFTGIDDYELMRLIVRHMSRDKANISVEELEQMSTREKICKYFSKNDMVCKTLFDVEVVMIIGYHDYTSALSNIATRIQDKLSEHVYEFIVFSTVKSIGECLEYTSDYQDFIDGIDMDKLCRNNCLNNDYLPDYSQEYAKKHADFTLNNANGIPKNIQIIDMHGYDAVLKVNGFSRFVNYDLKAIYIDYSSFNKVHIFPNGTIKTVHRNGVSKKLIFINKTQEFVTGYETKNGYKYKPAQLKELFLAISIHDTDEDEQNAYSVINFLCQKYDTYIFRDLYNDFLQSDGLLLPLLITETAQYRTKQELFDKHYHMPISGKWNKKNSNLTYLILKLRPRLTDEALARAMQCKNAPKIKKVGKKRYIMTYILYEALYGISAGNYHGDGLLSDALYEEYQGKKIKLLPENQTINEHNARQVIQKSKTVKFKIKKNTKFKELIDNMPENYELIKTSKRLASEGIMQKNCVASYDHKINSDNCMIYSVVFENIRYTVEIIQVNGNYEVAQCRKACNQAANPQLLNELQQTLNKINKGGSP